MVCVTCLICLCCVLNCDVRTFVLSEGRPSNLPCRVALQGCCTTSHSLTLRRTGSCSSCRRCSRSWCRAFPLPLRRCHWQVRLGLQLCKRIEGCLQCAKQFNDPVFRNHPMA